MDTVVMVIHLFLALALIGVILLQPTADSGGLTSSSSSMSGFMTPRGSANLLTRTTIILALGFMATSLGLVILSGTHHPTSVLDQIDSNAAPAVPSTAPAKAAPAKPVVPTVPTGK